MKIRLLKTPSTVAKGNYTELTVDFRNLVTDKVGSRKILSFKFPDVFVALKDAQPDSEWTVNDVKNQESGFFDWVGIKAGVEAGGEVVAVAQSSSQGVAGRPKSAPVAQREWEDREERARRQVLIVRQNALSNAVTLLGVGAKETDVLRIADFFFDWSFRIKDDAVAAYLSAADEVPWKKA